MQVTIEELSDKVLLKIFRYFLYTSPRHWIRLVHICHKWRRVVFEAQRPLPLRLFCTYGTPVLKTLDCWPALPIVVEYGGSPALGPPTPEDEDNIVAALKRSERVTSITLTVTGSLLTKLSTLEGPFSKLEDLVLLSRDNVRRYLPSTFLWGPRLRRLHSTSIAFPAILQLLSSSSNLVDLLLHDVLNISHFSLETLAKSLSGMSQLRSLSLHLPPAFTYRAPPPPSKECFVLPALTHLDFRGMSCYLEILVAIIDARRLEDIEITLLDNPVFRHLNLREFIDRMETHKSPSRTHILFSEDAISISLMRPAAPTCLRLQLVCKPLSMQLYFMDRICVDISTFLLNVRGLRISVTRPEWAEWQKRHYLERWVEILGSFSRVTRLRLDAKHLTNVMHTLLALERRPNIVLPALHKIYIPQAMHHATLTKSVMSLITSRHLSGHAITVEYEQSGEICVTGPYAAVPSSTPANSF